MCERLRKIYMVLVAPAIAGVVAVFVLRSGTNTIILPVQIMAVVAPAILVLATVFAVAGPIFYRSLFAHTHRNADRISSAILYGYERNLIVMALVTPYLAVIAYCVQLPRFHLSTIIILALYAAYYHFPSKKRITFDQKIFRVADVTIIETRN